MECDWIGCAFSCTQTYLVAFKLLFCTFTVQKCVYGHGTIVILYLQVLIAIRTCLSVRVDTILLCIDVYRLFN